MSALLGGPPGDLVRVPKRLLKGIYRLPQRDLEGRGLSKSFISRDIIGITPFRVLTTLLITYLLSPPALPSGAVELWGFGV